MKPIEKYTSGNAADRTALILVVDEHGYTAAELPTDTGTAVHMMTPADLLALQDWLSKHYNRINGLYRRSQATIALDESIDAEPAEAADAEAP